MNLIVGTKDKQPAQEERCASPNPRELAGAELQMGDKQFGKIQDKVIKFVRRNSLLKEAQRLPK